MCGTQRSINSGEVLSPAGGVEPRLFYRFKANAAMPADAWVNLELVFRITSMRQVAPSSWSPLVLHGDLRRSDRRFGAKS